MPKLLQINIVSNILSTGKICEDIAKVAQSKGWQIYMAYGRWSCHSICESVRIGTDLDMYIHYVQHRLFDQEGLSSYYATKQLVHWINNIKPDVIHLHNLHDHYLNYPYLFKHLATLDIPIVWTQHDCWSFTGGCFYPDLYDCDKYLSGCKGECPNKRAIFFNKSEDQFSLKQEVFSKTKNITLVTVSNWLEGLLRQTYHNNRHIITIHNGIDINKFTYYKSTTISSKNNCKFNILGVAAIWDKRKGLSDFFSLRTILPEQFDITLVGLTNKQIKTLPKGIKGIIRTSNLDEMVQLYRTADVFVNTTYSDNFPTTNIEALACGTPVITYDTGGSPEAIDEKTGVVVKQGDIAALANAILQLKQNPLSSEDCRKRAEKLFDKDKCFEKYIKLYEDLINK